MVRKDEEELEEEEEEEEEEEKKGGNTTFKLIVIFALGITVGFIIHKVLQERNSQKQERVILVSPEGRKVYDQHITPKFETSTTMHTPKMVNLRNIINKNTPGNNIIEVNGMRIEKDTGHLVVDKNPSKYETMIVKRDLVTGEIIDIVMMDDGIIK